MLVYRMVARILVVLLDLEYFVYVVLYILKPIGLEFLYLVSSSKIIFCLNKGVVEE